MTREEAIRELEEDKAMYMPEEWIESLDRDTPDGRLITALEMAIRDVQKMRFITEILDAWKSDKHTYYVLEEIRKVVEDGEDKENYHELSWLGKNCKDCGNKKCKKLGTLPKGYDCALWQAESGDKEMTREE